jgi:hypothetical protein
MNYTELTQAIKDYCENTETTFSNNISTFVKQAENRIYRKVNLPVNYRCQLGSMTTNNKYLTCPSDFLVPSNLMVTSGTSESSLLFKDKSFLREAYPDDSVTGLPKFYAQHDNDTFAIAPTPDQNYSVEIYYYYQPESIVTASTTWLGDNADEVLLYGSLVEAYTFMKGDADMLTLYGQRYDDALAALKIQAEGRMTIDEYRDGMIRMPRS